MKCAVITPIGPGHHELYEQARLSVEAAFNKSKGPFEDVFLLGMDDTEGLLGRSNARNQAIHIAQENGVEWLFFLDADDVMHEDCFACLSPYIEDYDALWGVIVEADHNLENIAVRPNQLIQVHELEELLLADPFLTLQMGHFVRTSVAAAVKFDATMDTAEDFKYYLEVWRQFHCIKIDKAFFINRRGAHSTGPRSASGRDWREALNRVFADFCWQHAITTRVDYKGRTTMFALSNPNDLIQHYQMEGVFFELEELAFLEDQVQKGAHIIEVGANIGNHLMFFSRYLEPAQIVAIEPNPDAIRVLERNVALNRCDNIDLSKLGVGLGARSGSYRLNVNNADNLGAARLEQTAGGGIPVEPLDTLVGEYPVDFIKIDVEGMELEVLEGGAKLIGRQRPKIFIEILNANKPGFERWLRANGYAVTREFRNVNASNYFIVPHTQ